MAQFTVLIWEDAKEVAVGLVVQQETLTISGVSQQTPAIIGTGGIPRHYRARLHAEANCFVQSGDDPTALNDYTQGMPLGAENPEYVDIQTGRRFAVIERL